MKLPVHQPDVYNIDRALADGWHCVGNRSDREDALRLAGAEVTSTGARHRVCAPDGSIVFDSAAPHSAWTQTLLSSAKRLRAGVQGDRNAEALEQLAAALGAPNGFIVKVANIAFRHDLCASTAAGACAAALASGLEEGSFTVEPFLVIRP